MFSVVIPLYNKEDSIKNTIQSVLNQTVQEFEIIIVDDGSNDKSLERVEEIEDSRIKIINKSNGGVSSARNVGVQNSKNEWITFLDGDDLWEENHLEEIVRMMSLYPGFKVYVTSFDYSDKRSFFRHSRKSRIFKIQNYFKEAIKEPLIWTSIVALNKECFEKVGYFETSLTHGEDLHYWSRLACSYELIKSQEITAIYKVDSENKATNKKFNYDSHIVSIIDLNSISSKDEKKYYLNIIKTIFKGTILNKDFSSFFKILKRYNFHLLSSLLKK